MKIILKTVQQIRKERAKELSDVLAHFAAGGQVQHLSRTTNRWRITTDPLESVSWTQLEGGSRLRKRPAAREAAK